jgi:DNA-binding NarL/FixJ family response regulator/Tfp pilus assembly protein PilF
MTDSQKVTVLLADEDSLRRDGLSAVLAANGGIEIVADCADGITALERIRHARPAVAIVDINLPGLHGIELVRRVRSEGLQTKIIIMSGTMDDDIVREVVRAGADAYLLKNGPARHLTDAISYVCDGGQYFSPQLRRDGRDRHLLEEPPRVAADPGRDESRAEDVSGSRESAERIRARRAGVHTADRARFQERIRNETSRGMEDRDYEIMAEMADGIRPILDRLDEIEERVMEMEEGDQPIPADPRGWLSAQLSAQLNDTRLGLRNVPGRPAASGRGSSREIEVNIPHLIEEAVNKRFQTMAGKLQEEIEEQHVRTLETFVKNIQVKLVQRVSALEQNMRQQTEAMLQLHDYNQRTEENLSRLISGVDKLAKELPKRLAAQQQLEAAGPESGGGWSETPSAEGERGAAREGQREKRAHRSAGSASSGSAKIKKLAPAIFWAVVAVAIVATGVHEFRSSGGDSGGKAPAKGNEGQAVAGNAASAAVKPVASADSEDIRTKLDAARQYMERKEYTTAEDIYKQVVLVQPDNVDALRGLASVLYREDKIEESAAVLDRLPKN